MPGQKRGKKQTTGEVKKAPNPTGKGGFQDNPQNRQDGGAFAVQNSFSYQYRRFSNMTVAEMEEFAKKPTDEMKVVEFLAFQRIVAARKSLKDVQEITDRTEGKARQTTDINLNGKIATALVEFVGDDELNLDGDARQPADES